MIDDVGQIAAAEASLNAFIEKRARGGKSGRERANDEADYWKAQDRRQTRVRRLVNARAWAAYFGGLALASHDAAARYAEKRDRARELVRQLETDGRGDAA